MCFDIDEFYDEKIFTNIKSDFVIKSVASYCYYFILAPFMKVHSIIM